MGEAVKPSAQPRRIRITTLPVSSPLVSRRAAAGKVEAAMPHQRLTSNARARSGWRSRREREMNPA